MSNPIGPFTPITPIAPLDSIESNPGKKVGNQGGESFSTLLQDALNNLENTQMEADQATAALVTGQTDDFHTPVIAMEKASLTLGLAVTVRNKVLNAYQEIMRMQI